MPKIKFLADRILRDEHEGTERQTVHKAGSVLTVSEESARHWLDRGVAELVEEKPRAKRAAKTEGDAEE